MSAPSTTAPFRLIYELGNAFAARTELDELIPFVVARCREVLDAEGVSVILLDPERDEFYFPFVSEDDAQVAGRLLGLRFAADRGIAGAVLRGGRPMRVDDVNADSRFYAEIDRHTRTATRAVIAAPLAVRGVSFGVVEAINRRGGGAFTDEDLGLLEALAESIAIAIENAQLLRQVEASEQRLRAQVGALRRDLARRDVFPEILGVDPQMVQVFRLMESAATAEIPVLIEGETGTGKELVARAIHRASSRADAPFLAVNCAAFAESLLESELFGHRRGSFTGATRDHIGLFRAANGGVLFLDEVSEMPPAMQAKLLRVLQDGEVVAVGDIRPQRVDVWVLCASNRDLKAAVAAGRFREDLFYRLAAFPISLPPLRKRAQDIPLLASTFLAAAAERNGKRIEQFDPAVLDSFARYEWPGNVRQLQNEIARAVAVAKDGEAIAFGHLSDTLARAVGSERTVAPAASPAGGTVARSSAAGDVRPGASNAEGNLRRARASFEAGYIAQVLRRNGQNVSHTARELGISRVALQKKMKEYALR